MKKLFFLILVLPFISFSQTLVNCNNDPFPGLLVTEINGPVSLLGSLPTNFVVQSVLEFDVNTTLNGNTIYMMPGSRIELSGGTSNLSRLVILDKVTIKSCNVNNTWQSIILDDVNEEIKITESFINDANIAIHSVDGGDFESDNNTFENNEIHIRVEDCGLHPAHIINTIFTNDNSTGIQTDRCIELENVEHIQIGVALSNISEINTFKNSRYFG